MILTGLSLVFALKASVQNSYTMHRVMEFSSEDSIALFGRYEYKNAAIHFNDKFYKLEGYKAVPSAVTIRGNPHSLDEKGNLSSTRNESIQIDSFELGKSYAVAMGDSMKHRVDQFLIAKHSVMDLTTGHSIDFANDTITASAIKNETLYIVLCGVKTEIGVLKRYRKANAQVDDEMAIEFKKFAIQKPGEWIDGLAGLQDGFLISVIGSGKERQLLKVSNEGALVTKVATQQVKSWGGEGDGRGMQFPRLTSFAQGTKFLWATEDTLWYGEMKEKSSKLSAR